MKFTAALLLALPLTAAPAHELYVAEGTPAAALEKALAPLKEAGAAEWQRIDIPAGAQGEEAAQRIARAIEAGIPALPCLALRDEEGVYAVLPLPGLTADKIKAAATAAQAPGRAEAAQRRRFDAQRYLLCARISRNDMDDEALAQAVADCRQLMTQRTAQQQDVQFLGLRCLYPLLMQQYARGYIGAHTPATEAKLLEAIAALEAARDLNRESSLGKEAHEERERLRAARRKSRQYE